MPYASSTGAPKRLSRSPNTDGASAAEQDRMNLKLSRGAPSSSALISSIWCIVGTAEYHVAPVSRCSPQNLLALNRDGATMLPPVFSVESATPISPCTWNSGMTTIATSSGVSSYVSPMLVSDAIRLACVSGTPLGLLVVPDVCRNSATSSGDGPSTSLLAVSAPPSRDSMTAPRSSSAADTAGIPSSAAASRPG